MPNLEDIAHGVSAHLEAYSVDLESYKWCVRLHDGSGHSFTIRNPLSNIDQPDVIKVEVSGGDVKMTASVSRGLQAIARDIERKIIPAVVETVAKRRAEKDTEQTAEAARNVTADSLKATGTVSGNDPTRLYMNVSGNTYGSARVSHGGQAVELEIRGLSPELAVKILNLIKEN